MISFEIASRGAWGIFSVAALILSVLGLLTGGFRSVLATRAIHFHFSTGSSNKNGACKSPFLKYKVDYFFRNSEEKQPYRRQSEEETRS